ncbi:hypothetical protein KJ781_05480 [Patescibacteria group bacterium]|nr:hypothetical protein [Patescibacteria group bacterium]MBU1449270.1 hypothetical protein [Patescibacteria group bacterium]
MKNVLENTISDLIVGKYRTWDCAMCGEEIPVSSDKYGCLCSQCEVKARDIEQEELNKHRCGFCGKKSDIMNIKQFGNANPEYYCGYC